MKSAASPRKDTTRLNALATGLRLTTTATPKASIKMAKNQKRNAGIRNCGLRIADCGLRAKSTIRFLTSGVRPLISFLLVPFQNDPVHDAADLKKFVFVMDHVFAGEPGDGVILAQKNCLLGANLLAHAAKNAADHVDIEFDRVLLDLGEPIGGWNLARHNLDGARRTDEFAKLTGNATDTTIGIADEGGRTAIMLRHLVIPFLLGILHGHFGATEEHVLKMLYGDGHAGDDRGQIHALAPVEFRTWNGDGHLVIFLFRFLFL